MFYKIVSKNSIADLALTVCTCISFSVLCMYVCECLYVCTHVYLLDVTYKPNL